MSLKPSIVVAFAMLISYAAGVVTAQLPEKLEVTGNMKVLGAGNGVIFPDGTKQTSAGVGTSNDVTCAAPCVGAGEIAAGSVGTSEVADNTLTADDLAPSSVGTSEVADNSLTSGDLATDSVGTTEIVVGAVGTSEVADNTLTASDLASNSVEAAEIAAGAVGTSEVSDNTLTSDDLADASVNSNEVVNKSLRLTDLNATVTMNYPFNIFLTINNGACSNFIGNGVGGVAANSFVLPFGLRLSTGAPATGWVVEAENTPSGGVDVVKLRICNFTGASADPPDLLINFWTLAQ